MLNLTLAQAGPTCARHLSDWGADVIIVLTPGATAVKHRLGIAYENLKPINPRLFKGSISGFGQDELYGDRAGINQIAQGTGGLMVGEVAGIPCGPIYAVDQAFADPQLSSRWAGRMTPMIS